MIASIQKIFTKHPGFAAWTFGALLSQIGSGFSQIAIYTELAHMGVKDSSFAYAFVVSLLPGLFSSQFGKSLAQKYRPLNLLIITEIFGALAALIPWLGIVNHNLPLIYLGLFISSMLPGLAYPISIGLFSQVFDDNELFTTSAIQTLTFSSQVVVGQGIAALLYSKVSIDIYFFIDSFSFVLSALTMFYAGKANSLFRSHLKRIEFNPNTAFGLSDPKKIKAFFTLPILAIVGTPAISLLPAIAKNYPMFNWFGLKTESVPLFLLFKAIGQMSGALILKPNHLKHLMNHPLSLWGIILGFSALYGLTSLHIFPVFMALVFIFAAHVLSNIAFTYATSLIPQVYKGIEASRAAAVQYQAQLTSMVCIGLLTGYGADLYGISKTILAAASIGIIALICLKYFEKSHE